MKTQVERVLMFCIMVVLVMINGTFVIWLLWSNQPQTLPRSDLEDMTWMLYAILLLGVTTSAYITYLFFTRWIAPRAPGGDDGDKP